jgi:hypothetical protein
MNAEILLYHLTRLGVTLALTIDARGLEIDAPRGALTSELTELIREFKGDLIEIIYAREEADAIAWEGCAGETKRAYATVSFEGDASLIERYANHPTVRTLSEFLRRHGGGVLEVMPDEERCAA